MRIRRFFAISRRLPPFVYYIGIHIDMTLSVNTSPFGSSTTRVRPSIRCADASHEIVNSLDKACCSCTYDRVAP